jgi:tRNA threonylcarbamoyladenosine biosynthesis protein TsaE
MNSHRSIIQERIFPYEELDSMAALLVGAKDDVSIYTFSGPLGAGKTTLIKAMLALMGVEEPVTSPTFTILQAYSNQNGHHFYHFDLYRIGTLEEFIEGGFQEYLYVPESWAFIEWPAVVMPLLKGRVCHVFLDYMSEKERVLRVSVES